MRGEGLFAHLWSLAARHPDVVARIGERLRVLDWFDGFRVPTDLGPGERRLVIRDRYLAADVELDQRSANEGFLFLLFVYTLLLSPDTPRFFAIDNADTSLNPLLCRQLSAPVRGLPPGLPRWASAGFLSEDGRAHLRGFDRRRRVDAAPRREGDRVRSHLELVLAVEERLCGVLSDADPAADLTRVAFAIAVDATECWLLLHLDPLRSKDTGCLEAANRVLRRRGCPPLTQGEVKHPRAYEQAARALRKPKEVAALSGRSPGLDRFIAAVRGLP